MEEKNTNPPVPISLEELYTSEELAEVDSQAGILVLSKGVTPLGHPYWAYMSLKPSKFIDFHKAQETGQGIDLDEFGEVLALGFGDEPPQEVCKEMEDLYGVNHNFETELIQKIMEVEERDRIYNRYIRKKEHKPESDATEGTTDTVGGS